MKIHRSLALLVILFLSVSCTREEAKDASRSQSEAAPAIVFSKELDFPRVYALLTGQGTDARTAGRAIAGQFVDWEVYVIGPYQWNPGRREELKKMNFPSEDSMKRELQMAEHPQRYLIAPSPKDSMGIVMRVGDGFKNYDQFGRIVSGFAAGQKLRAKGRILIRGDGSIEFGVYEISPSNAP